ncbi:MAG: hypothetical protein ACREVE_06505 [Gammaproteobacteria bacterium]
MVTQYWKTAALLVSIALPAGGLADIIRLPGSDPEVVQLRDGPRRGMAKDQVQQRYGKPANRAPAVGEPPISRWDYPDYSVYFEGEHVLHAVARPAK